MTFTTCTLVPVSYRRPRARQILIHEIVRSLQIRARPIRRVQGVLGRRAVLTALHKSVPMPEHRETEVRRHDARAISELLSHSDSDVFRKQD